MIDRVLIQKKNGEFATINGWQAWYGFDQKAYPISFFEWPQLRDGNLKITPETLVVGGVSTVLHTLRILGKVPKTIDYPEALLPYLGRKIWPTTMAEARGLVIAGEKIFIKPREVHKAFAGYLFESFRDLIPTAAQPDDLAVWVAEPVYFISEWRYFIRRNEIIGIGHYNGNVFIHPDEKIVRAAVETYKPSAPVAYAVDFGVTKSGKSLLVEVNDAYSLGHIGLRPIPYTNMLEDRWIELVRNST